ncbi:MAG: hypothetical protein ACRD35_02015 [Candidatus Acidiferrales bacterium]
MSAAVYALAGFAVAVLQAHNSHGGGSGTRPAAYEYVLVGLAIVGMVWTLYLAVRYTVRPGEDRPDHIKRAILEDDEGSSHV